MMSTIIFKSYKSKGPLLVKLLDTYSNGLSFQVLLGNCTHSVSNFDFPITYNFLFPDYITEDRLWSQEGAILTTLQKAEQKAAVVELGKIWKKLKRRVTL